MRLHIIYRSYGGDNMKSRPAYYSKRLALESMLRAAELADGVTITYMNDGPIPEDRLELMLRTGRIVSLPGVGMRKSYVAGLRFALSQAWKDDDVVWFSEDDYLYDPQAFRALRAAATGVEAAYFALYGGTRDFPINVHDANNGWFPRGWGRGVREEVQGQHWEQIVSTASTFGVRVGALRQDLSIFLQGLLPHKKRYRDHDTCVVYQGFQPHDWSVLARDLVGLSDGTWQERVHEAALAPFKAALNVRAHRRRRNRRVLLAVAPNLATHLEVEWLSPGRDWEEVAKDTVLWAQRQGTAPG